MNKAYLFCPFIFLAASLLSATELTYEIETGDETDSFYLTIKENDDGTTYTSRYRSLTQIYVYDRLNNTVEWRYEDSEMNTSYRAVRTGTRIRVTGRLNGKPVQKVLTVPDYIWGQNGEFALMDFVKSGRPYEDFFVIKPDDLTVNRMRMRKEKTEEILFNGKTVQTVRYKAQLLGLLALLWQAQYWYRLPDYAFILYKTSGAPGIPATKIRLMGESY
jgi:hypothetical protein